MEKQMDMSAAALPPITGRSTEADRAHPLYREWRAAEANNTRLMINGQDFKSWLYQRERQQVNDDWAKHPQFPAFVAWMRENKGGAPGRSKLIFPDNFKFWLAGGRW